MGMCKIRLESQGERGRESTDTVTMEIPDTIMHADVCHMNLNLENGTCLP